MRLFCPRIIEPETPPGFIAWIEFDELHGVLDLDFVLIQQMDGSTYGLWLDYLGGHLGIVPSGLA